VIDRKLFPANCMVFRYRFYTARSYRWCKHRAEREKEHGPELSNELGRVCFLVDSGRERRTAEFVPPLRSTCLVQTNFPPVLTDRYMFAARAHGPCQSLRGLSKQCRSYSGLHYRESRRFSSRMKLASDSSFAASSAGRITSLASASTLGGFPGGL